MKKIIAFTVFVLLLSAQVVVAQCLRTGNFISNGSDTPTSGSTSLIFNTNGTKQIQLGSNFSTPNNGPDIHVILCQTASYTPSTDLIISGVLTQITGAQTFSVPSNVSLNQYQYILIHCVQYNHRFGYASLGNPTGTSCSTLATSNFDSDFNTIRAFPNPTKDQLTFSVQEDSKVMIYDSIGKKIGNNLNISRVNNSISLDSYPKGIYMVEVISDNKKSIHKIIKI